MSGLDTEGPLRRLRDRDAVQPAHRPRPALASSARGLAKQELRRQRELEANEEFARANEILEIVVSKKAGASSSASGSSVAGSQQASIASTSQDRAHTLTLSDSDRTAKAVDESHNDCNTVGATVDALDVTVCSETKRNGKRNIDCVDDALLGGHAEATETTATAEPDFIAIDKVVGSFQSPRKRVNIADEFDDSGFWEDDIADDEMDWAAIVEQDYEASELAATQASARAAASQTVKMSESMGAFQWAGKRGVEKVNVSSEKAKEAVRKLQELFDSDEAGMANAPESSSAVSLRTPLRPSTAIHTNINQIEARTTTPAPAARQDVDHVQVGCVTNASPLRPQYASSQQFAGFTPVRQSAAFRQHEGTPLALPFASRVNPIEARSPSLSALRTPSSGLKRRLGSSIRSATFSSPLKAFKIIAENSSDSLAAIASPLSQSVAVKFPRQSLRSKQHTFKSPFKKGFPLPASLNSQGRLSQGAVNSPIASQRSQSMRQIASASTSEHVFDLDASVPRESLSQVATSSDWTWRKSGSQAFRDAAEHDAIQAILADPHAARRFAFVSEDDDDDQFAVEEARKALTLAVGSADAEVDFEWVRNHFGLIVWKLAAMAFHRSAYLGLFCKDEVVRQLRYRFEREVLRAQRSCIKRMQERDSSAAMPMVLCVYDVSTVKDSAPEDGDEAYIILTDGWYRIRALLDATLMRAVQSGRIKQGQKLAIMGAQLDSASMACEPIEGYAMSPLTLRGNGTKLARWDARLGFTKSKFVASLRSLAADGGVVPLMDLVVVKAHPKAYISEEERRPVKSSFDDARAQAFTPAETWSAFEEEEKEREWSAKHQGAREEVEQIFRERGQKLSDLIEMLSEECCNLPDDTGINIDPHSCEDQLNAMLASRTPHQYLRIKLVLPATLRLAQQRMDAMQDAGRAELDKLLEERCPSRKRRSFRMVVVREAALEVERAAADAPSGRGAATASAPGLAGPVTETLRKCRREGLLRVWDVDEMGEREPREGGRYRITNLQPVRLSSWPKKVDEYDDVHLSTRRDTRWYELPMPVFAAVKEETT